MFLRREGEGAVKASIQIAHIMFRSKNNIKSYKSTCIRVWSKEYLLTGKLPSFRQGLHPKHESIVCDEHVKTRLQVHLRSLKPNKRTPLQLCTDYNAGLLSDLSHAPSSIGLRTAYRWMRYLGFSPDRAKKGYYSDEHNRPDIIISLLINILTIITLLETKTTMQHINLLFLKRLLQSKQFLGEL
jgi:hypothetical protein